MAKPIKTQLHKDLIALIAEAQKAFAIYPPRTNDGYYAMLDTANALALESGITHIADFKKKDDALTLLYKYLAHYVVDTPLALPAITKELMAMGSLLRHYSYSDCPIVHLRYGLALLALTYAHTTLYMAKNVCITDVLHKAHLLVAQNPDDEYSLFIDKETLLNLVHFVAQEWGLFLRAMRYRQKFGVETHGELWRVCHLMMVQKYPEHFSGDSTDISAGLF